MKKLKNFLNKLAGTLYLWRAGLSSGLEGEAAARSLSGRKAADSGGPAPLWRSSRRSRISSSSRAEPPVPTVRTKEALECQIYKKQSGT